MQLGIDLAATQRKLGAIERLKAWDDLMMWHISDEVQEIRYKQGAVFSRYVDENKYMQLWYIKRLVCTCSKPLFSLVPDNLHLYCFHG